jgi:dephospho-CoA kinase
MFPRDPPALGVPVIGVLGGVASGKSLVAAEFAALGAGILDGDRAGHEVLRMPEVEQAARRRWGEAILAADGRIDRSRLARIVFAGTPQAAEDLAYLESVTHPRIGRRLLDEARALVGGGAAALVLDAAVMLKAGWDRLCDTIVYVDAPPQVRLARALARGWTAEALAAREASQGPEAAKRRRADWVIDNGGAVDQTRAQVAAVWQAVVASKR